MNNFTFLKIKIKLRHAECRNKFSDYLLLIDHWYASLLFFQQFNIYMNFVHDMYTSI